jgi:hypothetical protein
LGGWIFIFSTVLLCRLDYGGYPTVRYLLVIFESRYDKMFMHVLRTDFVFLSSFLS